MPTPQSYANHSRRDPAFHFVLQPLLALNLAASIVWTVRHSPGHLKLGLWQVGMAIVLFYMAVLIRMYALKDQNRIIRLEERLRLARLLPAQDAALAHQLTTRQLVALRFASDAELPALARRAVAESLDAKYIKQAIQNWRPDHERI
jgi:hypothetical protein